jgi:hypothetical protein
MPPERNYLLALENLFQRKHVVLLDDLRNALQTHSRTTIFRVLSSVGYHTSYSHAGRFYTLKDIPKFNDPGIWFWRDVGFSAHGTLRATAVSLVEQAPAGQTHEELQGQLRLRLHDTLLNLVEAKALTRRPWEDIYVYLNANHEAAAAQWVKRQTLVRHPMEPKPVLPLDPARVIEILVDVIHHPKDEAKATARRLSARGLAVTPEHVEAVFGSYGVKKTVRSRLRRSRY